MHQEERSRKRQGEWVLVGCVSLMSLGFFLGINSTMLGGSYSYYFESDISAQPPLVIVVVFFLLFF